jgi:DNA-binding beta-propeller fold protein YncE
VPSKTITQNVSNPTGVAFDLFGNLWVANYGGGSVTEYTDGVQNAGHTITNGILGPEAIAIDGLGNVWVENDYVNVTVYSPDYPFSPPTTLLWTLTPAFPVYGIALSGQTFAFGGNNSVTIEAATSALANVGLVQAVFPNGAFALATDNTGRTYTGGLNNTVTVLTDGNEQELLQLSFTPAGIAIDNTRGRLYISNQNGNSISVYSTAGAFLKTIE